ncbi:hypothetical protein BB560_004337 [Smittium megazygosporum]|uniref:Acylamino-acid-releasing enzyme n=1 Tax=Smittium megazygosporum TaxID=133381 RepID=A0A2T9Z9H9_9FUNG|nr:hypothetical protein BB560_004337 [Smittium megazygosporum]
MASKIVNVAKKAPKEFFSDSWRLLELIYSIPTITGATIQKTSFNNLYSINYTTKQSDFVRDTPRSFANFATISTASDYPNTLVSKNDPVELQNVALSCKSQNPSSILRAVLRSIESSGSKKRYVEVWRGSCLLKSLEVTSFHGDFYSDGSLSGIEWSPSERYLVYVAEPKEIEKSKPRGYAKPSEQSSTELSDKQLTGRTSVGLADQNRFRFNEDFGESYSGKRPPVLIVVDVLEESVKVVEGELAKQSGITPGQPVWVSTSSGQERIVFTGYNTKARHMGLIYTQNRPSDLFICDIEGENLSKLTDGLYSVRSPRPTPDGKTIVYFASEVYGPHAGCSKLMRVDPETSSITEIVPIIHKSTPSATDLYPARFPGIYALNLPKRPWLSRDDGTQVLFVNSIWESSDAVLAIDIQSHKVSALSNPNNSHGSLVFLSSCSDAVLFAFSTPSKTQDLIVAPISTNTDDFGVSVAVDKWVDLDLVSKDLESSKIIEEGIEWEVLEYPEKTQYLQTILTRPKKSTSYHKYFTDSGKPPLVICPHGGPHSTLTAGVTFTPSLLTLFGFTVAQINYTGSLGFGQESVDQLIGKIGDLDVEEIVYVANDLANSKKTVNKERMVYTGGSHSGFTGAHIAGRYPGLFKAIVLRNPVISIGEMFAKTDIPDWCFSEVGIRYDPNLCLDNPPETLLTPETYEKLWKASPQQYVANVQDPILLNIGSIDRRVPPEQGYQFYRLLKANGKRAECLVYQQTGHPIDSTEAMRESPLSILEFFYKYVGIEP